MSFGYQFYQIFIALFVFCEQNQVVADIVDAGPFLVAPFLGDIDFTADDRFDAADFGFFVEFHGSVHIAVIGDRHRIHAKRFDLIQ